VRAALPQTGHKQEKKKKQHNTKKNKTKKKIKMKTENGVRR